MSNRQLMNYLPPVIQEIREFQAITNAEQLIVDDLWKSADDALLDNFVVVATEYGISRWEKMLKISPPPSATLEERRFTVLTRIIEQRPFTIRTLRTMLTALCGADGFTVILTANEYSLAVKVALVAKRSYNDVAKLLRRVVPANLTTSVTIMYNTHQTLASYRHQDLTAYSHYDLRNEVLTNGSNANP